MFTYFDHLECSACLQTYGPATLINLCACGAPVLARYRLEDAAEALIATASPALVVALPCHAAGPEPRPDRLLGEGMTPLIRAERLGKQLGLKHLYIKDEALNPTGSFKARGLALAVARAAELGVRRVAIPSAGNAGGATAAYAARAGLEAYVFMPRMCHRPLLPSATSTAPMWNSLMASTDAGKRVAAGREAHGWFDLSTLKEPYRVEGKNHGVRNRRATGLGAAECDRLSYGRRHGPHRHVEKF